MIWLKIWIIGEPLWMQHSTSEFRLSLLLSVFQSFYLYIVYIIVFSLFICSSCISICSKVDKLFIAYLLYFISCTFLFFIFFIYPSAIFLSSPCFPRNLLANIYFLLFIWLCHINCLLSSFFSRFNLHNNIL